MFDTPLYQLWTPISSLGGLKESLLSVSSKTDGNVTAVELDNVSRDKLHLPASAAYFAAMNPDQKATPVTTIDEKNKFSDEIEAYMFSNIRTKNTGVDFSKWANDWNESIGEDTRGIYPKVEHLLAQYYKKLRDNICSKETIRSYLTEDRQLRRSLRQATHHIAMPKQVSLSFASSSQDHGTEIVPTHFQSQPILMDGHLSTTVVTDLPPTVSNGNASTKRKSNRGNGAINSRCTTCGHQRFSKEMLNMHSRTGTCEVPADQYRTPCYCMEYNQKGKRAKGTKHFHPCRCTKCSGSGEE